MAKLLKIDTEKLVNGNYMFLVPEDYRTHASMASWDSDLYSLQYATGMFKNNHHLSSFKGNLSKLKTGNEMFYNCVSLTAVDCGNLDSLRYGSGMFYGCYDLKDFPYSLPNLFDGTDMFANCYLNAASVDKILSYLPSGSGQLDLTCWDDGCEKAAQILGIPKDTCINPYWYGGYKKEYRGWKVYLSHKNGGYYIQNGSGGSGDVIVGSGLDKFVYCGTANEVSSIDPDYKSTKYLDGGRWYYNLSNLSNGHEMFYSWSHLTGFYADLHKMTDGEGMFQYCDNLNSFNSSLYNLSSGYRMFAGCNNLTDFYPTQGLANLENGVEMFKGCKLNYSSVHSILSSIPTVTSNHYLTLGMDYSGCEKAAETIGIPNGTRIPNNGDGYQTNYKGWYLYLYAYNHYYIQDNYGSVSSGYDMFANCKTVDEVKSIDSNYKSTRYLDNGKWYYNLSSLTNGRDMFYSWNHLTNFEAELYSLQYGENMFRRCDNLTSFGTDLPQLRSGGNMFEYCTNLESFNSDLSMLYSGSYMFGNCSKLNSFESNLSSLHSGHGMFFNCGSLRTFSADLHNLTSGGGMFNYCSSLTSFYGELSSLMYGGGMFYNCRLDADSVDIILSSIPQNNNNETLTIGMGYDGCEKAAEILNIPKGTRIPQNGDGYQIDYKGWGLYLYCYQHYNIQGDYESGGSGGSGGVINPDECVLPQFEIVEGGKYVPDASMWASEVKTQNNLTDMITRVSGGYVYGEYEGSGSGSSGVETIKYKGCKTVNNVKAVDPNYLTTDIVNGVWSEGLGDLEDGNPTDEWYGGMFYNCSALTSFSSDLSSLTDGYCMFNGCSNLTSFSSDLSSLTDGYSMFSSCKLNTASVQNIADTINTPSSKGTIHISIGNITPNSQETAAFNKIASKNWTVYVEVNGGYGSQWNPTSLTPIDGEEQQTPIPFWAKPVPATEERARYIDNDGNYYNILGGNYIYGDDLSTYGMFVSEEDAAANMRLTKIEPTNTNNK